MALFFYHILFRIRNTLSPPTVPHKYFRCPAKSSLATHGNPYLRDLFHMVRKYRRKTSTPAPEQKKSFAMGLQGLLFAPQLQRANEMSDHAARRWTCIGRSQPCGSTGGSAQRVSAPNRRRMCPTRVAMHERLQPRGHPVSYARLSRHRAPKVVGSHHRGHAVSVRCSG